jgi:hypothetical protein
MAAGAVSGCAEEERGRAFMSGPSRIRILAVAKFRPSALIEMPEEPSRWSRRLI